MFYSVETLLVLHYAIVSFWCHPICRPNKVTERKMMNLFPSNSVINALFEYAIYSPLCCTKLSHLCQLYFWNISVFIWHSENLLIFGLYVVFEGHLHIWNLSPFIIIVAGCKMNVHHIQLVVVYLLIILGRPLCKTLFVTSKLCFFVVMRFFKYRVCLIWMGKIFKFFQVIAIITFQKL